MKNWHQKSKKYLFAVFLALYTSYSVPATTSLSDAPLATEGSAIAVKPNIAFVVDDSGSMSDENMPDSDNTHKSQICWGWFKYNTLAYNPAVTYKPPYKSDGSVYSDGVKRYPDASFSGAKKDGYLGSSDSYDGKNSGTSDLSDLSKLSTGEILCRAYVATLKLNDSSKSMKATSLKVEGDELLDNSTGSTKIADELGQDIVKQIDKSGYSGFYDSSTNTLTIYSTNNVDNDVKPKLKLEIDGKQSENPSPQVSNVTNFSLKETIGGCPSGKTKTKYYYSTHSLGSADPECSAPDSIYSMVANSNNIVAPNVATGSPEAKTNYANWYSYYRKRAYTMKAATSEAFSRLSENYRVGLFFISSKESEVKEASSMPNSDLKISDFSGSHRTTFFNKLSTHKEAGWTPLRGALSRMGRIYAGKVSGWDPVQYSCQQNFALLSTDGYWNDDKENIPGKDTSPPYYGPLKEDGTTLVGNVDKLTVAAWAKISVTSTIDSKNKVAIDSINVGSISLIDTTISSKSTAYDIINEINTGINNFSGTTGYTAALDKNNKCSSSKKSDLPCVVIITAPTEAGNIVSPPVISGTNIYKLEANSFSGYVAGVGKPYQDNTGVDNTLADVAYYYYTTDLRTSTLGNCKNTIDGTEYKDLCTNNVTGAGRDVNSQQHMTTFTIGLGVSGSIPYPNNNQYESGNSWQTWPDPNAQNEYKIDDLWHAAVNGRGTYYAASNSTALAAGIQEALAGVEARVGSSSASATSTLELTTEDHQVFQALYRTVNWDGDLRNCTIDPSTGEIAKDGNGACIAVWNAQATLDSQASRSIKYFSLGKTNNLQDFTYTNINADGKANLFANACSKSPSLQQCSSGALSSAQLTLLNQAEKLIPFLRGESTYEKDNNATDPLYRGRDHILGDIVNAVPVFVKAPMFEYGQYDATYADFRTANAKREAVVYAAANDGMLHAFAVTDGAEKWAFVPSFVMSKMYRLADYNYSSNHIFLTDGSPTVADVCSELASKLDASVPGCRSKNDWNTILVAGLNKGGCGYYALDVTDPATPKGLWEFKDDNLGYSYGNPIITRRKDGRWVVIVSSGYNNVPGGCSTTGDGNGHVFVLDAMTGEKLEDIATKLPGGSSAGNATTPSGLAKLNAWVESPALNVADRLYGGDLLGNVWRIDFDNNVGASGKEAMLLGNLTAGGKAQPITTKPELYYLSSVSAPLVLVGTGKYLGTEDPLNTDQQSIYALKDSNGTSGLGDVRNNATVLSRTLLQTTNKEGTSIRKIDEGDNINWASNNGWYIDLNPAGSAPTERVNIDMQLQYNLLTVATNVPEQIACTQGGSAWKFDIDVETGEAASTVSDAAIATFLGNSLVAGIKVVKLDTGQTITIVTDTSGKIFSVSNPSPSAGGASGVRRTMWREIFD